MMRKTTLGLLAAAALALSALTPSAASAHGFHGGGWGWHHHHHGFFGFGFAPTVVVDDGCLVREVVETRRGPRLRMVNVCGY